MTSSLAQHTPLESLLLLHALRSHGLTAIGQISEQLKNIPLIRNDPTYDSARLNEDALKHLYLGLLKDEAHLHLDPERKRRQQSPTLPTVEEAAKHSHLIPRLVHRLYARYRQDVVAEIRDEEARYDSLTREIEEIEVEQKNEKIREEQAATAAAPPPPPPPPPADERVQPQPFSEPKAPAPSTAQAPEPATPAVSADVNGNATKDEGATIADQVNGTVQQQEPSRLSRAKIDAVINHDPVAARPTPTPPLPPPTSQPQQQQQTTQQAPTATALPPLSEMAPESHMNQQSSPHMHQQSSPHLGHHVPGHQLPAPLQSGPGYRLSPVIQQGGFAPQFARPHGQGSPQPSHSPSPSSPRPVLPLPPGMSMQQLPSHSPVMQNRGGPAPYPSPNQRLPPVPLQPARPPHMHTPPSYPQPYPPAYHQPQPAYGSRPPHPGGYQLPPFQVSAQDPNRVHQHHVPQQVAPQHVRPQGTPVRQSGPAAYPPHTPYSHPGHATHPGHARLMDTILSSLTKKKSHSTWKGSRPSYLSRPFEVESPAPEPISPTRKRAPSPPRQPKEAAAEPTPTKESEPEPEPEAEPEPEPEPTPQVEEPREPTPKPVMSSRKSTRRNRAPSIASSAVASSIRARTRSHSVLSHTDNQSANHEPPVSSNLIKDEPMTPADLLQEELLAHEETPTQTRASRTRRGNASSSKRKRQPSTSPPAQEEEESVEPPGYETPPNDKVQASRNFQRMSQVIMNDITTHKHAGPFQKPVREKDAEGYGDIIKRPQDLKSIKAAITFGARAINAATSSTTDSPAATPGAGGSGASVIVTLDKTADLVPPRAIVNSSQLEKEVMRMFANAVMFNPGDGGMVQDAREMADDIEAKVRDWRGAERQVEGREKDDDEEVQVPAGKRRKL